MAATSFPMTLVGACENIRKEAAELAGQNYAFNLGRATGALDFVTDPSNGGIETQLVSPDNGNHVATLKVLYDQRTRPCQISTDPSTNVCNDTGTTPARKQFFIDINKKISTPARYFSNDDMVVICNGTKEFIRMRLENDLRAGREALDEFILAELNGMVGKNYHWDGTTTAAGSYKSLQLLKTDSNVGDIPNPSNYVSIQQDFLNNQLGGTMAVIGQGYFDRYIRLQNLSCCNSLTPYSEAVATAGAAYYFDQAANAVLGNNKVIVLPYGSVHMVTFNKNNNININNELEQHIVITDPVNPAIKWNLDFKWDCTTERWKYMYSLHWNIFNIFRSDSFSTDTGTPDCGDELYGMNSVFGYQITRG